MISENLQRVRERIAAAALFSGRDPQEVRLVAATKGISVDRIREAVAAGVREIGENRVQEAQEKRCQVPEADLMPGTDLRWHLIGRLQRNKAKQAVEMFNVIHSVDSLELIEALEKQAALLRPGQHERGLELLIQVNVSGEATKGGCRPEETATLAEAILRTRHLRWTGLMTLAPYSENPEDARPFFRHLRRLRDDLQRRLFQPALDLSMGMSGDFDAAVQEGATMVRVGTAIFGERK